MTKNTNLINHALRLSEDYPVFPCKDDKSPACNYGLYAATKNPDNIEMLFSAPNAKLIGVPTGKISGISVIDIDVKNGKEGLNWIRKNKENLGNTRISTTRSGGFHYYYKHTLGLRNKVGIDGCVDIRGEGGYVIAPPSEGYKWLNDEELAPFPRFIHENSNNFNIVLPSYSTMDLTSMTQLRDSYQGKNWNSIVSTICYNAIEDNWSDHQFRNFIAPICDNGASDKDLDSIIKSIRKTKNKPDNGDTSAIEITKFRRLPLSPIGVIEPSSLKHRELIYGKHYIAGTISLTVAAGGVGKSMVVIFEACDMADKGHRVILLMLEDDPNEIKLRIKACLTHHSFCEEKVGENLIILNDEVRLTVAKLEQNKHISVDTDKLKNAAIEFGAKVLIADPFVQTHQMNENDNGQINFVADQFRSIAKKQNIAVMLVHHSRKGSDNNTRGENARGASALKDAARSVRELRQIGEAEAIDLNIAKEFSHEFIAIDHTKSNYTQRDERKYMRKISIEIINGSSFSHKSATVETYTPLTYDDLVTDEHYNKIKLMIIKARNEGKPFVRNPRRGSRDIYKEAQNEIGLPIFVIKKMIAEMENDGVLEKRKMGRCDAALAVSGIE